MKLSIYYDKWFHRAQRFIDTVHRESNITEPLIEAVRFDT